MGDSYRVEARIVIWENPNALHAPAGALCQRRGEWHIYSVDQGRARLRTVVIGRSNGIRTVVVSGIEAGVEVVVYPGDKVSDGARVASLPITGR